MSLSLITLYQPPAGSPTSVDLIFVHGLGGDGLNTWSSGNVCWPRDFLKDEFPNAHIFTYDYDSSPVKILERTSRTTIFGHAESILNEIARYRASISQEEAISRPIIFLCHSLGGLLVKEALIRSSEYHRSQVYHHPNPGLISSCVSGIIFLGTPHRGSNKANIAKVITRAVRVLDVNDRLLKVLEKNSDILERERNSFDLLRKDLCVSCLYEELPMQLGGMIVPEVSACIDGSDVFKEPIPGRNHRTMVKFASKQEKAYEIVLSHIRRAVQIAVSNTKRDLCMTLENPPTTPSSPDRSITYSAQITSMMKSCILNSLEFPEINDRYNGIERAHKGVVYAHQNTFDWIFDPSGPGLVDWLQRGKGIFWVNGKAGSGKSTLLKFIKDDPRLVSELKARSTPEVQVVIADFFFWAAGTEEQRSQTGLMMTLLHRILRQIDALIPKAMPGIWERVGLISAEIVRISENEKAEARKRRMLIGNDGSTALLPQICKQAHLQWTRRALIQLFCDTMDKLPPSILLFIMIDGLDEYDAQEEEMDELIDILKRASETGNVRVCLSTRPWTIFERHFGGGQYPTFELQHLTHNDIKMFVTDSFERSKLMQNFRQAYPRQVSSMVPSIIAKAEGVFLWVRLVIRAIIRSLQNGDELPDLQRKIDELPRDLEQLYVHLLERIEPKCREKAFRIFSIIRAAPQPPTALTIWYSGDTHANPLEPLTIDTKLARCYQVHLRLMSQCAGLLELRHHRLTRGGSQSNAEIDLLQPDQIEAFSDQQHYLHSTVHYLHRTTKDFLDKPDMADMLEKCLGQRAGFDPHKWLAVHVLVELSSLISKTRRYYDPEELFEFEGFTLSRINNAFNALNMKCRDCESGSRLAKIRDALLASINLSTAGSVISVMSEKEERVEMSTAEGLFLSFLAEEGAQII